MILVSRLNETKFLVNPDMIEFIEETPDTVVTLMSGRKIVVSEPAEEIVRRIVAYRHRIYTNLPQIKPPQELSE